MKPLRKIGAIFVTDDDPGFLEAEVEPTRQLMDFNALNVSDLRAERVRRSKLFSTTPFDPEGRQFRLWPGGVTLWSGFAGGGKTTLLRQVACHLMHRDQGVFVCSLEEDQLDIFYRHASVALGTEDPSTDGLQWCVDVWADKLRLWTGRDDAEHMKLFAMIRFLAKQGIKHAIIDSLMCLDIDSGDWEGQRQFAKKLVQCARDSGVHIHLVAHPRKVKSAEELDMYDIAGAAAIVNRVDNVLTVRRGDASSVDGVTQMLVSIKKQRYAPACLTEIGGWYSRYLCQCVSDQFQREPTRFLPELAYERRLGAQWG